MINLDTITNGEIQLQIGGKLRTLKFGMLTFKLMQTNPGSADIDNLALPLWAALMVRQSVNELPEGFSIDTALEWMDDMSEDDVVTVFALSQKAQERLKNVNGRVNILLGLNEDGTPLTTGKNSRLPVTK